MTNMEMIVCIIIYAVIILGVLFMIWAILDLFETNKFKIKCVRRKLGTKEVVDYYPLRMHCSFVWHEMCENVFGSYSEAAGCIRLVYEKEHPTHIRCTK